MKTNRMKPVLAANQNSGSSTACSKRNQEQPRPAKKMTPNAGSVISVAAAAPDAARDTGRSRPAISEDQRRQRSSSRTPPATAACQPPRNSSVAIEQTVIMLAYSAMKNAANFMLLYSVWKPGHQFVLGFRQIERHAIGFRERRDHEDDEAENLRERRLENVPVRDECRSRTRLRLHDLAQAQRVRNQQRRGDREHSGSS